jgi:hypothetical protein
MYRLLLSLLLLCGAASAAELKITVSDKLPPPIVYTQEVKAMSDAAFFTWATGQNKEQKRLSEERSAKGEPMYVQGYMTRITGNTGRGLTTESRPVKFKNPLYTGPGPLTVVNPYCRFKD